MIWSLVDQLPDESAALQLLGIFEKLLKKYARLLGTEDAYEELRLFFFELLDQLKEKGICADSDGYIVNYISKSVRRILPCQRLEIHAKSIYFQTFQRNKCFSLNNSPHQTTTMIYPHFFQRTASCLSTSKQSFGCSLWMIIPSKKLPSSSVSADRLLIKQRIGHWGRFAKRT